MRKQAMFFPGGMDKSMQGSPYASDFYQYFEHLTKIEEIPDYVVNRLWGFANKVHQLTNLNDRDVRILMMEVDNVLTRLRMWIPEWEYSPDMDVMLKEMEVLFYSMIKRSYEGFERRMQATQIRQVEYSEQENRPRSGGFVRRFFGGGQK